MAVESARMRDGAARFMTGKRGAGVRRHMAGFKKRYTFGEVLGGGGWGLVRLECQGNRRR